MVRPYAAQFPVYREYERKRQEANNAIVALLAGSALAAHTLQMNEGSTRILPEIFPNVPHISRFNLRPSAATEILVDAGMHLAIVTMPYALAIHEDFVSKCIRWIHRDVKPSLIPTGFPDSDASNMHNVVANQVGGSFDATESVALELFHLFRLMRNCHIHAGGAVSPKLRKHIIGMSTDACLRWAELTHREPAKILQSEQAEYSLFDIFAVFAISKELARAVNRVLRDCLSEQQWATICVRDFTAETSRSPRSERWGRGLIRHANLLYRSVHLTADALFAAAVAEGVWPDATRRP